MESHLQLHTRTQHMSTHSCTHTYTVHIIHMHMNIFTRHKSEKRREKKILEKSSR